MNIIFVAIAIQKKYFKINFCQKKLLRAVFKIIYNYQELFKVLEKN